MADKYTEIFHIKADRFQCMMIDSTKISISSNEDFEAKLDASLAAWRKAGKRGIWVKVATKHAKLIYLCTQRGFEFHHAQPGYAMLKLWLPTDEPDIIPDYANQYLGCAGFVVNDKDQVLLIKEKWNLGEAKWKLPGGHANPGEEVGEAAQREVLEETGIPTEFVCVLNFRHQHNFRYGCSDFYFICLLKAQSTEVKMDQNEIAEVTWMNVDEYAQLPSITAANRHFAENYQRIKSGKTHDLVILPEPVINYTGKSTHLIYSVLPQNTAGKQSTSSDTK